MNKIETYIRNVKNFPKEGVSFKDITPLLNNAEATKKTLENLITLVGNQKIDKVVGVEARGFFFATLLAQYFNVGFIPIRKPNKLPFSTISESYKLEYGTDSLQIHTDAIKKGEKILIHDDVLATGGTTQAVCKLVERLGGIIVQCNFLIELTFLKGKEKLSQYEIASMLKY